MATTLTNSRIELSKQLGDFWSGTTTSAGVTGGTTVIDTALKAKADDWIDTETEAYDIITSATNASVNEERQITALANSTGTLTVLAHGAQIGSSVGYEVHRLFTPSEKRRALIAACRHAYPHVYDRIWNEEMVSKNWLSDGSFERWTTSSNLAEWTETTLTATQTTASPYYKHGANSCKLDTLAGNISQSITNWDDLKKLAGKTVVFTIQGWCDTASCLRISVYDGVNAESYSSYHAGDSAWTRDDPRYNTMYVQYNVSYNPTQLTFKIYHAVAAGVSYVDDARVTASDVESPRQYIGHLGLTENAPLQVFVEHANYRNTEPWILVEGVEIDYEGGYMYLPAYVARDRRLRIKGYAYLDFLASGSSSTAWTATVNLNQPQLDILIAQAALYLYTEMSVPNFGQGTRRDFQEMIGYWKQELNERVGKFGMEPFPIPVKFT